MKTRWETKILIGETTCITLVSSRNHRRLTLSHLLHLIDTGADSIHLYFTSDTKPGEQNLWIINPEILIVNQNIISLYSFKILPNQSIKIPASPSSSTECQIRALDTFFPVINPSGPSTYVLDQVPAISVLFTLSFFKKMVNLVISNNL